MHIHFMVEKIARFLHNEFMEKDSEIEKLRAEIVVLRAEVKDVRDAIKLESSSSTKHIKELYRRSREIYEFIFPLIGKIFPNMMKDLQRVQAFIEGKISPPDKH